MLKSIISEGKTSSEAIEKGLKQLGCKEEDVNVKVLDNKDKKSFFSILDPRIVKVELTVKENQNKGFSDKEKTICSKDDLEQSKKSIYSFLNEFGKQYGNINFDIIEDQNSLKININGENAFKLIGYRGEVINSFQNILSAIGNKNTEIRVPICLDIEQYREKRERTLIDLANKLEKTVSRTGKKVVLEPMIAYERKVIHTTLQNSSKVDTYSIGEEPRRKIVIEKK